MPLRLKPAPFPFQKLSLGYCLLCMSICTGLFGGHSHLFKVGPGPHHANLLRTAKSYKAGVNVRQKKSTLSAEPIDYLEHIIWQSHFELAEHTAEAMAKLEHPMTKLELSLIQGMRNFLGRFIASFVYLDAFFRTKLKENQSKHFEPMDRTERASVPSLKNVLITPPVLALLRSESQYTLNAKA